MPRGKPPEPRTRARGDGTVTLRRGQWYAVAPLPPVDGKRRREWRKATPNTERGAEQTLRRLLTEIASRPAPADRYRLGEWLASWLDRRAGAIRPNTLRLEQQAVTRLAPLHRVWLDELAPARVQAWVDGEVSAGYAPRTVANRLAVLRAALTLATDLELIPRNPAARVRSPRIPHVERPILTADQARALLAAVEDTPYAPVFGVGVALGLRLGEALGLRWSDVDLDGGWLHVRRQAQPIRGGPRGAVDLDAPLKTPAARRTLPLPPPLAALLRRHRERQRLIGGHAFALVCTSRHGLPLHPGTVAQAWRDTYRDRINAPVGLTYHDLRHSAASLLAAAGVPPHTLKAWLGHTSLVMTDHYSHATPEGLREAAATMGRTLQGEREHGLG